MQPENSSTPSPEENIQAAIPAKGFRRWFGSSAFIALGVFVLGRLALEPLRSIPQVDNEGLEPFGAVETIRLRENPVPVEVAFLGSSQTIWGIDTSTIAKKIKCKPSRVINLGTAGGTPFEMWNIVRRNPKEFYHLRLAVIELNPFILRPGLEGDPRVFASVSSRATLKERFLLQERGDRMWQVAEWALPLNSVRRSLESNLHNMVGNRKWRHINPDLDGRIKPGKGWSMASQKVIRKKERHTITPEKTAKRLVGSWQVSSFQDHALRSLLQWMKDHGVPVVLHHMPVHPEVVEYMLNDPRFSESYQDYRDYVDSLRPKPKAIFSYTSPEEFGGDADNMADRTHLNESGALLYSAQLGEKIRRYLRRIPNPGVVENP